MLPAQNVKAQLAEFLQVMAVRASTPERPLLQVFALFPGFRAVVENYVKKVQGGPLQIKTDDLTRFYDYLTQQGVPLSDSEKATGFTLLAKVLEEEISFQQPPSSSASPSAGNPAAAPYFTLPEGPHFTPYATPPVGPPSGFRPGVPAPPPGKTFSAPVVIILVSFVVVLLVIVLVQALN